MLDTDWAELSRLTGIVYALCTGAERANFHPELGGLLALLESTWIECAGGDARTTGGETPALHFLRFALDGSF